MQSLCGEGPPYPTKQHKQQNVRRSQRNSGCQLFPLKRVQMETGQSSFFLAYEPLSPFGPPPPHKSKTNSNGESIEICWTNTAWKTNHQSLLDFFEHIKSASEPVQGTQMKIGFCSWENFTCVYIYTHVHLSFYLCTCVVIQRKSLSPALPYWVLSQQHQILKLRFRWSPGS